MNTPFSPRYLAFLIFVSTSISTWAKVPYAEETFDTVWETLYNSFYDANFGGLDWVAYRDRYRPEVLEAESRAEMIDLLNEMLQALKHSHLRVVDAHGTIAGIDVESGIAHAPVALAPIEQSFFVQSDDTKPQGLNPGDELIAVGELTSAYIFESLDEAGFSEPTQIFYAGMILEAALSGPAGSEVEVTIRRDEEERTTTLKRMLRTDQQWMSLPGMTGEQPISISSKFLEDGIAYLQFSMFAPALMPEIRSFIQNLPKDCPGLIIDLRNNPGGIGLMAPGLLGTLIEENKPCGRMILRSGELGFTAYAQSHAFFGKLAVLVNSRSASTSEFFAAAVKDNERGKVIGTQTAGMALASLFKELPNGSTLQYVIANFERADGTFIEGIGVAPDIEVPHTLESLCAGEDAAIDAAISYILDLEEPDSEESDSDPPVEEINELPSEEQTNST